MITTKDEISWKNMTVRAIVSGQSPSGSYTLVAPLRLALHEADVDSRACAATATSMAGFTLDKTNLKI